MYCVMKITFSLIVLALSFDNVALYNIDTAISKLKFIVSPVVKATDIANDSIPSLHDDIKPSFFGYGLVFHNSREENRIVISSPKVTDADNPAGQVLTISGETYIAEGNIEECLIVFDPSVANCSSVGLPDVESGDSFAMTLDNNEQLRACSPSKVQHCPLGDYTPGYCYTSDDFGASWNNISGKLPECPGPRLDLMFVLDGSGSVNAENFQTVRRWTADMALRFDTESDFARIGVVEYSYYNASRSLDDQLYIKTEVELGSFKNKTELEAAIMNIPYYTYTTHTAEALNKTVFDFEGSDRYTKDSTKKVIILLTDGRTTDSSRLHETAAYVRSLGIQIYAVGVAEYVEEELRIIATGNIASSERVFEVGGFEQLVEIVNNLQSQINDFALEGFSVGTNTYEMEQGQVGSSMITSQRISTK